MIEDQSDDCGMMSDEDFERQSVYHVPDKPCPPYAFDRIRKTLPSNVTLLPSAAEPNVSRHCVVYVLHFAAPDV